MVCSSCGCDCRPGARFCGSCGSRLPECCGGCGAQLSAGVRFCEECGSPVAGAAPPTRARKVVTAVFGDLVGSTALQETLDPESAQRVMSRFYEVMRAVIARHGGQLDKFVGDGVVAVFGVPAVREDDALRAVRCAAAMVTELAELSEELRRGWGVRLRMRTGVNTGELVVSGDGELVGDAINTAARLEQAAAPGEVLVGEQTWRLVRHVVRLEAVPPLTLKGKAEPVRAWRLLAGEPAPGRARAEAPLVGRAGELDRLRCALDAAIRERACRLVTVIGSPGMGKSRLAEEFAAGVGADASVVLGRCEPSGEGITFGPVAELLRGAAEIGDSDPPRQVRAKLAALVEGERDAERIVARAGSLLGVTDPASVQETFWGVRRVLEALARDRPLVVVLEDVHWGQPLLLDLVEHLAEWVRDAPMLLLTLSRPELRETREALTATGRRVADVIELAALEPGESRAFVDGLLGRADLPPDLLERILATTEGNPLFLGETLRMLVDDGSLTRRGEVWVTAGPDTVSVPPTIHALLSARIERLQGAERAVVERAAVIGKQFYRGAVASLVSERVRFGLDGHLETLRRKEMVEPDGTYWVDEPVYRFHHVLLRDAAYRSLLKEARAELHERFADWLTTKAGELVGEHEEVIAYHLEQAHEYRRQLGALDDAGRALGVRAAAMLGSAGRRALARADLAAAANLLGRACERVEVDEPELLWDLAEALLSAGDTGAARPVVDRLTGARAEVLTSQIAILIGADDPESVVSRLTDAAGSLAGDGDGVGAAKAHHVAAEGLVQLGRFAAAEAALDRALVAARKADDGRRTTAVLAAAPRAALWGPSPMVRSSGRCLDVLRILRMTPGNRHVEAIALRCQAVLEAVRGRFDPARSILHTARTTLQELGLSWELQELAIHAGLVELLAGDPVAAGTAFREARDGFTALGVDVGAAQAAGLLARALVEQGRDDEAIEQTRFAERHAGGDLKTTIAWCGARAEALARGGRGAEAVALAERAVDLAEPTDALPDKADAALALARVLRAVGRADEARAAAAKARELYQAKDHTVGVARATELAGLPVVARREAAPAEGVPARGDRPPDGRRDLLGDRPPERFFAEYARRFAARDIDGLLELYADDVRRVDHRALGWEVLAKHDLRASFESIFAVGSDYRFETGEVLACDDRVIALPITIHGTGTDGGGAFEIAYSLVAVIEDGRMAGADQYESDDRRAMIARYAEVGGGQGPLGDRPPERVMREIVCAMARNDLDAFFDLVTDDLVLIDHRRLGWSQSDKAGYRDIMESMLAASSDVRGDVDEVLACDNRILAAVYVFRGHSSDGGGVFEIANGMVNVFEDGRVSRAERFEPEDRAGMLARFTELSVRRPDVLGDRPPERMINRFRHLFDRHDVDAILKLYSDDHVRVDHRTLGWGDHSRDDVRPLWESMFAASPDIRAAYEEVLACDDRVVAFTFSCVGTSVDGGGSFEIPIGAVVVVEDGVFTRSEQFDHDDRQAMIARYAELGGGQGPLGDRPPERVYREVFRRFARADVNGVMELFAEEYAMIEHRSLGWVETDKDGLSRVVESVLSASRDVRGEVDEILACDDRIMAARFAFRGHSADSGGAFEIVTGMVYVIEDGLIRHADRYESDDRGAMLARYAELGGRSSVFGDRPVERVVARMCRRWTPANVDELVELFTDDVVRVDHRGLGHEEARGRTGIREVYSAMLGVSAEVHIDPEEVLACDARVLVLRATLRGTAAEGGGEFATPCGYVFVVGDGRVRRLEQFEPDDRRNMVVRYTELGGGLGPLGDRPPERIVRELAQRIVRRELDAVGELIADDEVTVDHRQFAWRETDKQGRLRIVASMLDASLDVRMDCDEVLACDDRVIAIRCAFRGHAKDGGGAFEIAMGSVYVIENDLLCCADRYEYEDREAMLARFAELTGARPAVLGDRPPERLFAESFRRAAVRDVDGFMELFVEDFVDVDHRSLAWAETGKTDARARLEGFYAVTAELRFEVDEVLACDDRVIALSVGVRGTSAEGGGRFEIAFGVVAVVEHDRIVRYERYEPDDRRAMVARYAELGGGLSVLGDRAPERAVAEFFRLIAQRDVDAFMALIADDQVVVDHRSLAWTETDKAGLRVLVESMLAAALDVRAEVDEILACNDRTIAYTYCFRGHTVDGGGDFEIAIGGVQVYRDGLLCRTDRYEHDDRQGILARYAELTGRRFAALGDRPPERLIAEAFGRAAVRDVDGFMELFVEDFVDVDHRSLAWAETGKADARVRLEGFHAVTTELRFEVDEVLACDDRVIAMSLAGRGTNLEGGAYEIAYGVVAVIENGLIHRWERYEPDDRRAMVARYAELGGGLGPLGDRPSERVMAELFRRTAAHDVDGYTKLFSDDYVEVDHRSLPWDEHSKADARTRLLGFMTSASDTRFEVEEVLARDDRVVALSLSIRGTGAEGGGPYEIAYYVVCVIEGEFLRGVDRYGLDDRQAALGRYAELVAAPETDQAARSER